MRDAFLEKADPHLFAPVLLLKQFGEAAAHDRANTGAATAEETKSQLAAMGELEHAISKTAQASGDAAVANAVAAADAKDKKARKEDADLSATSDYLNASKLQDQVDKDKLEAAKAREMALALAHGQSDLSLKRIELAGGPDKATHEAKQAASKALSTTALQSAKVGQTKFAALDGKSKGDPASIPPELVRSTIHAQQARDLDPTWSGNQAVVSQQQEALGIVSGVFDTTLGEMKLPAHAGTLTVDKDTAQTFITTRRDTLVNEKSALQANLTLNPLSDKMTAESRERRRESATRLAEIDRQGQEALLDGATAQAQIAGKPLAVADFSANWSHYEKLQARLAELQSSPGDGVELAQVQHALDDIRGPKAPGIVSLAEARQSVDTQAHEVGERQADLDAWKQEIGAKPEKWQLDELAFKEQAVAKATDEQRARQGKLDQVETLAEGTDDRYTSDKTLADAARTTVPTQEQTLSLAVAEGENGAPLGSA